jgi:hypothetical protein
VPIPSDIRASAAEALDEFCRQHSSPFETNVQRYTYTFETNAVALIEQRPAFMNASEWTSKAIARFRYSEARNNWSLYWRDAAAKWHRVSNVSADKDIKVLLQVVVSDPLGVFWS